MVRLSRFFAVTILVASAASAHQIVDVRMSFDVPQFVPIGQSFRYRVIADDLANDNGSGIVVTIVLPSQTKFSNVTKSDTWRCSESHLTLTCTADQIVPGPNPIDVNVIAPGQTMSLHATTNVQSLGSLDPNSSNDNASSDIYAFDPAACTAATPALLAPADGGSAPAVAALSWTAVPGAKSYTIFTAVEGAAGGPALIVNGDRAQLVAEPGTSEWWVVASFATCPSVTSSHRRFTATATVPRAARVYAGDSSIDATGDGPRLSATFRSPFGLALSPNGDLYVSDQIDSVVRRISNDEVTTIAGAIGKSGTTEGQFALFQGPRGLAVTPLDGNVYAADTLNNEVRILYIGGPFVPAYNVSGDAKFDAPSGLAATKRGNLYVADTRNNSIRKMTQVPGFVGLFSVATVASGLHAPLGVAVDVNEIVYIADTDDGSIRKTDGSIVATGFDHPTGVALDSRGNLFVTDRTSVYRIAPSGLVTNVVTGLRAPAGIVVDASDRILVAESGGHDILAIDPAQNSSRQRAVH
jgi:DNA-binding beta-propeller fold protein YncE